MNYETNEFDPAEIQLFITEHKLYNIRSQETFKTLFPNITRLKIDGMITYRNKIFRSSYDNIYGKNRGIFIINGDAFDVRFKNPNRVRTQLYFSELGDVFLLSVYEIFIPKSENNSILDSIRSKGKQKTAYSFVVNLKIPTLDSLAPKLLLDSV